MEGRMKVLFALVAALLAAGTVVGGATAGMDSLVYRHSETSASDSSHLRFARSPLEENPEEAADAISSASFPEDRADTDPTVRDALFRDFDISDEKVNSTVAKSAERHNETIKPDNKKYYDSRPVDYSSVWVDLDKLNSSGSDVIVREHALLSKSYRRAATIKLNFPFPFYGHDVRNITIATGGFLYTGQYVHSWLAATQYIAPLMANFDTSQDERAKIRYADNGTALIVEWANVHLQDNSMSRHSYYSGNGSVPGDESSDKSDPAAPKADTEKKSEQKPKRDFTFQVILRDDGGIFFAYKDIPVVINTIEDTEHPVKVGLSDAYIIDRTIFFVRRKTIYEYHRMSLPKEKISSQTAIYFAALTTCNRRKTCEDCVKRDELQCKWCPVLNLCSDGLDRNRQDWLNYGCDRKNAADDYECQMARTEGGRNILFQHKDKEAHNDDGEVSSLSKSQPMHAGLVILLIFLLLLTTLCVWVCYAYFFPHTWSGQLLIKYRPTRWHWLRGEPRYTAASIHM